MTRRAFPQGSTASLAMSPRTQPRFPQERQAVAGPPRYGPSARLAPPPTPADPNASPSPLPADPDVTVISVGRMRVSRVTGFNHVPVRFQVNQPFYSYEIRAVSGEGSPLTEGTRVEVGPGGPADAQYDADVTGDEVYAASSQNGAKVLKVYARRLGFRVGVGRVGRDRL